MNSFAEFIENIKRNGLEYYGLFYGSYNGIVVNNDDPDSRGRLQIQCPEVWGNEDIKTWIIPRGIYAGKKTGFHAMPQKDDVITVTFRGGNPSPEYARWEYGWWLKDDTIDIAEKDVYVFSTPKGHLWVIDEKKDKIYFQYKDGKGIYIVKDKVYVAKENSNVPATLGDKNADLHKDIIQLIIDIIQAIQSAPVVPLDGGASFKAALVASLTNTLVKATLYKSTNADETKSKIVFLE